MSADACDHIASVTHANRRTPVERIPMLHRLDADTYQCNAGDTVTIVAQSDDGAPSATFRYLKKLTTQQIQGNPGRTFDVVEGVKMFACAVVFGQGAAPRYDLFEVDAAGVLVDLDFPITPDMGPTAQFRIDGLPVAVLAAASPKSAGPRRATKKKRARRKAGATKAGSKKKPKGARKTVKSRRRVRRKPRGGR